MHLFLGWGHWGKRKQEKRSDEWADIRLIRALSDAPQSPSHAIMRLGGDDHDVDDDGKSSRMFSSSSSFPDGMDGISLKR